MDEIEFQPPSTALGRILDGIAIVSPDVDCVVTGLVADSRDVKPGHCFIAKPGSSTDGRDFVANALQNGASSVIYESSGSLPQELMDAIESTDNDVSFVPVLDCYQHVGSIASRFYDDPSSQIWCTAVTGTNGKTTVAYLIAEAMMHMKKTCGFIGTIGVGMPDNLVGGSLTTPSADKMQKILADFRDRGADSVVLEASSHGIAQQRVGGIHIDTAILTNLDNDHLDYHGSRAEYAKAKQQLFEMQIRCAVLNLDDDVGRSFTTVCDTAVKIIGYTKHPTNQPDVLVAHDVDSGLNGTTVHVISSMGDCIINSPLVGRFQVDNLLAALGGLVSKGIDLKQAAQALSQVSKVPGRMEVFGGGTQPVVVVDYAHTPHALEASLRGLKPFCQRNLWCVFGCGGNRDTQRRANMGKIAERYSDQIIITDDNPRYEDPESITTEILAGLICPWAVKVEHDRNTAIAQAISEAEAGDIVLIAGKGHERMQLIQDRSIWQSDIDQVLLHLSMAEV